MKPTSIPSKTRSIGTAKLGNRELGEAQEHAQAAPDGCSEHGSQKNRRRYIGSLFPKKAPTAPKAKRIRRAMMRLIDTSVGVYPPFDKATQS